MKINRIIVTLFTVMVVAAVLYFVLINNNSQKSFYEQAIESVKKEDFRGVIAKKYKGKGRDKILLRSDTISIEMDFVYENTSLTKYLRVGDSIEKKSGLLQIRVVRGTNDTIIPLKFENISKSK